MNYSFNLEWKELDEDLREEKIDELITYNFENGDYDDDNDLDWYLEDEITRERAEKDIRTHFPLYF